MSVLIIVGTIKGAFFLRSDQSREKWDIEGPIFKGWKATAGHRDPKGRILLALASDVYGASIHVSEDVKNWTQIENGPAYPKESGRTLSQIWTIETHGETYYAGVDEAGLFQSADAGKNWLPLNGLNEHPTRSAWQPGSRCHPRHARRHRLTRNRIRHRHQTTPRLKRGPH